MNYECVPLKEISLCPSSSVPPTTDCDEARCPVEPPPYQTVIICLIHNAIRIIFLKRIRQIKSLPPRIEIGRF